MPRSNLSGPSVLAAAALLADRDGFDALTVAAVARHLDVQPASLYEHVKGRDALLDGLHRLALGKLGTRIGDELAGRSGKAALRGLVTAHRDFANEHPGGWAALQRTAAAETVQSPESARLASLLIAVVRGYPVPESSHVHAARVVAATVNGFLALTDAAAFDHRSESQDESWAAAIDALDRALSTWPTEGRQA